MPLLWRRSGRERIYAPVLAPLRWLPTGVTKEDAIGKRGVDQFFRHRSTGSLV